MLAYACPIMVLEKVAQEWIKEPGHLASPPILGSVETVREVQFAEKHHRKDAYRDGATTELSPHGDDDDHDGMQLFAAIWKVVKLAMVSIGSITI